MKTKINKKILAIIPTRGGSKGIPYKNIKLLAGKPLLEYSIIEARKSKYIDRVIVSTEDDKIKQTAELLGVEVIERPVELAQDKTAMDPVLQQAIEYLEKNKNYYPDLVLLLQPTSPLRKARHIDEAIEKYFSMEIDTLISVEFIYEHSYVLVGDGDTIAPISRGRENRQQRKPVIIENGAVYLTKAELIKRGRIFGERLGCYGMDKIASIDIDTEEDFLMADSILKYVK